ncbi:hypothetical protein Q31b_48060 [Novipirellula aureliae]|uniref:Uncharacterized protein n=1 Tax=Novipirellula aureliae TaxID=2527966 RepID=A0A5C6DJV7_9BACT|nr:hypothetical protein [Novipirellula aureliae]TWU36525.1 hypothetical protein Q31b_48060 [Novipirellula aureliae]
MAVSVVDLIKDPMLCGISYKIHYELLRCQSHISGYSNEYVAACFPPYPPSDSDMQICLLLRCFYTPKSMLGLAFAIPLLFSASGCEQSDPVVTYEIPTEAPAAFRGDTQQMLAAMFPAEGKTWFFKVTGPESAIELVESDLKNFVTNVKFTGGNPDLSELPEGWRIGADKPMRFASVNIDTPEKQLDLSISSLSTQSDWDAEVLANVNRWRRQFGIPPSSKKWAEGEAFEVAAADEQAIWVDLKTEATDDNPAMAAGPMTAPPMADVMNSRMPNDDVHSGLAMPASAAEQPATAESQEDAKEDADANSKIKYERPDGWRTGRMSSMRLAAFNVGPEDAEAEITIIPAGGDLRGNVARWLGQIRPSGVSDETVDKMIEDAEKIVVDGKESQRFILEGEESDGKTTSIDATIVPLEDGFSLFIKMTGPAETVADQYEATTSFIQSLKL